MGDGSGANTGGKNGVHANAPETGSKGIGTCAWWCGEAAATPR
jgi:hypothetical protein